MGQAINQIDLLCSLQPSKHWSILVRQTSPRPLWCQERLSTKAKSMEFWVWVTSLDRKCVG